MQANRHKKTGLMVLAPVILLLIILIGDTVTRIVMGLVLVCDLIWLFLMLKKEKSEKAFNEILRESKPTDDSLDPVEAETIVVTGKFVPQPGHKPAAPSFRQSSVTTSEATPKPRTGNIITLGDEEPSDISQRYFEIINEAAPGIENNKATVNFFLDKVIKLIREVVMAHSAVFYWVNRDTKKLTAAAYVVGTDQFSPLPIPLESDLLSRVVTGEEPVTRGAIDQKEEPALIKYYNRPIGIISFAAVPIFFGKKVIGVLAVDQKERDAFGSETLFTLGRYVRIITHVLSILQTGFFEGLAEKRLKAMNLIIDQMLVSNSVEDILAVFEQRLRELIPAKIIYFLEFQGAANSLRISRVFTADGSEYTLPVVEVEIGNSLAGVQLSNMGPLYYRNLGEEELPRFHSTEERLEQGSFFTVPLTIHGQMLGILCFESPVNNAFTVAETRFVARLNSLLSYVFYNYSLQMMLRNEVLYDPETKVMNNRFFVEKVEQDMHRLKEFSLAGTFALVCADKSPEQMELFEGELSSRPYLRLAEFLKAEQNPNITIGKIEGETFGIFFFGTESKEMFIWAERFKTKVAKQSATSSVGGNSFTVSIGVAPAENKSNFDELLQTARLALTKSQNAGGGKVTSST